MFVPCFIMQYLVSFLVTFATILMGKRELGCFALFVFLEFGDCHCVVALPRGAVG